MGMGVLESDDLANHSLCKLLGVTPRPAGELGHPLQPALVKTLSPFVPGLGANPVFLA
jgi:hypothetical protein